MRIRRLTLEDADVWTALRTALWPHCSAADHDADIRDMLARPDRLAAYGAVDPAVGIVGFAELSVRDVVDGTRSSPFDLDACSARLRRNGPRRSVRESRFPRRLATPVAL